MLRSLNLLLGFAVSPSSLLRCQPRRNFVSLPNISTLSCRNIASLHKGSLLCAPCSLSRGDFRVFRMSSGGSETSSEADVSAAGPSVVPHGMHKPKILFCHSCGSPTKHDIPDGEEKIRALCTACGRIHYENPKMVVGCLVEHNDKVLLCKRKIEPSYGLWTLPAGFLEIGESAAEGAARETLEEASAEVKILSPFAQIDIPRIGHMYIEDIKAGNFKFHYCTISKRPGASPSDPRGFTVEYHLHS